MWTVKTALERAREDLWVFRTTRKDSFQEYLSRFEYEVRADERARALSAPATEEVQG